MRHLWLSCTLGACVLFAFVPISAHAKSCSVTLQNQAGDSISGSITLSTSDPNENGEGESLSASSSGGDFAASIGDYGAPFPFHFQAKQANETISGTISGYDADESCSITATVNGAKTFTTQQKKKANKLGLAMGIGGFGGTVVGLVACTAVTGGLCGAVVTILGSGVALLGGGFLFIGGDPPAADYTVIATPHVPSVPRITPGNGLNQQQADAFNALLSNTEELIGLSRAAYVSGNRASGAHDAGSKLWEIRQVQAGQLYALQMAPLLSQRVGLLHSLHDAIGTAGFSYYLSSGQAYNFEFHAAYYGLPSRIVNSLDEFDATPGEINQVRNLLLVQNINEVAGNFPASLVSPGRIAALKDAARAFSGTPIDVKPDSTVNPINPRSHGVIPVAILGSKALNVATIVPSTIRFGPHGAKSATPAKIEDVNNDGIPDMLFRFSTQASGVTCGATRVVVTGDTQGKQMFSGIDSIKTVGCPKGR